MYRRVIVAGVADLVRVGDARLERRRRRLEFLDRLRGGEPRIAHGLYERVPRFGRRGVVRVDARGTARSGEGSRGTVIAAVRSSGRRRVRSSGGHRSRAGVVRFRLFLGMATTRGGEGSRVDDAGARAPSVVIFVEHRRDVAHEHVRRARSNHLREGRDRLGHLRAELGEVRHLPLAAQGNKPRQICETIVRAPAGFGLDASAGSPRARDDPRASPEMRRDARRSRGLDRQRGAARHPRRLSLWGLKVQLPQKRKCDRASSAESTPIHPR